MPLKCLVFRVASGGGILGCPSGDPEVGLGSPRKSVSRSQVRDDTRVAQCRLDGEVADSEETQKAERFRETFIGDCRSALEKLAGRMARNHELLPRVALE